MVLETPASVFSRFVKAWSLEKQPSGFKNRARSVDEIRYIVSMLMLLLIALSNKHIELLLNEPVEFSFTM